MRFYLCSLSCLLAVWLTGLTGCKNGNTETGNAVSLPAATYSLSDEPGETVVKCLDWYLKNVDRLNTLWCATTTPNPCDTAEMAQVYPHSITDSATIDSIGRHTFYKVNYAGLENFLAPFKRSGYYSDVFLNNIRNDFKRIDENWKKEPEYVIGGPGELEYDVMAFGDMFYRDSVNLKKGKILELKQTGDKVDLTHQFPPPNNFVVLSFKLSKNNNVWQVDSSYTDRRFDIERKQ